MGNLVKQTGLALASFGLATVAFAGSYSEGCDCEITIPKYAGGVRVGVEALYFGVDVRNTEYSFSYQSQSGVEVYRSHNVSSDKDWGLAIELAYVAAGTGNDFVVNWTDHSFSGSDSIATPGGDTSSEIHSMILVEIDNYDFWSFGEDSPEMDSDEELSTAKGKYEVDYHKVDVEAGQAIQIGHDSVTLRFHAGLRYADVDTTFTAFLEDESSRSKNASFSATSDFDGLGPRVGVDGTWHLGNNFSFVTEISAALLVGDASARQRYEDIESTEPPLDYKFNHRVSFDHIVVPNLEARLGVSYMHHFSNSSELNLEMGYHVTHYFDVDFKTSYSNRDFSGTDVGMYGLYLKADYTV